MGPPPDPEQMIQMLQNPQFQSTMNEALSNPALIDMMIQQNPTLRQMGPAARQMLQSPHFRRMMTDPEAIRSTMNMQRMMGMDPFGNRGGGSGGFPAPGVTDNTPGEGDAGRTDSATPGQTDSTGTPQQQPPPNPFAMFGQPGAGGAQGNPFAALFGNNPAFGGQGQGTTPQTSPPPTASAGQGTPAQTGTPGANQEGSNPPNPFGNIFGQQQQGGQQQNPFANLGQNPFLQDPAMLQNLMQAMGGGGAGGQGQGQNQGQGQGQGQDWMANMMAQMYGGGNGGGMGGGMGGGSPAPPDNRPPEERYAEQLRQLNDMGFYEFERNIEALRRTGGSVQGAVEYLLSHGS